MKRRRRNFDSLARIIYSVKNLTFFISTNFFIIVNQSFFRNHDFFHEESFDSIRPTTDVTSDFIFYSTTNFISDFIFENDILFALFSTTDSKFRIIEEKESVQSNLRNEELNLHIDFNVRRIFLEIQNTGNSHHLLILSSSIHLASKVFDNSSHNLINKILRN